MCFKLCATVCVCFSYGKCERRPDKLQKECFCVVCRRDSLWKATSNSAPESQLTNGAVSHSSHPPQRLLCHPGWGLEGARRVWPLKREYLILDVVFLDLVVLNFMLKPVSDVFVCGLCVCFFRRTDIRRSP